MTSDLMQASLERVFREIFDDDSLVLTDDVTRETLKAWDSLGHIRLVAAIEEAFDVHFSIEQIEKLTSVAKIKAELSGVA
jgi:acyl carrier protein